VAEPRQSRKRAAVWLGVIVLSIALAVSAVVWWRRAGPRDVPLEPAWIATVTTIAGDGVSAVRDGDASRARFADPFGIAAGPDGTIYVADGVNAHRIRALSPDGLVRTVAGGERGFADGSGVAARFDTPSGLAVDSQGVVYVADTGNSAIRRITPDGQVSTVAGDGVAGYRDGPASIARFNSPLGVAVEASGRVIVADTYNDRVRAIATDGTVTTLAGGSDPGGVDGGAADARFDTPSGVSVDAAGTIYVADTGNGVVRAIARGGDVSTLPLPTGDLLLRPTGIAAAPGFVYVTDDRGRVVELSPVGGGRIVAGLRPGFADGDGDGARFRRPSGLAWRGPGRLVVADSGNSLLRIVEAKSHRDARLPAPPEIAPHFDAAAFAWQPLLWPLDPMAGPFEIAGTMGEARGGDAERLHAGIDVRADEGTEVRAVRDDAVRGAEAAFDFGSLTESIRIGAVAYVHVRVGRLRHDEAIDPARFVPTYDGSGKMIRIRVKRGARFATGETIGTVNRFNHVHLNVGWAGEEYNPLRFRLPQFEDTVPPTIPPRGVTIYDEYMQPLTRRMKGRLLVRGRVHIVVDAWDQANANLSRRRLGLYALGYQVLGANGTPAPGFEVPRETIRFDRLSTEPDVAKLVYAPGSGIPFYGRRRTRFLYAVTNRFVDGAASAGEWDATQLPPGNYTLRIRAADINGNEAIANRDLPITIVQP
jgi:sugar lactone lactonase YvrE